MANHMGFPRALFQSGIAIAKFLAISEINLPDIYRNRSEIEQVIFDPVINVGNRTDRPTVVPENSSHIRQNGDVDFSISADDHLAIRHFCGYTSPMK